MRLHLYQTGHHDEDVETDHCLSLLCGEGGEITKRVLELGKFESIRSHLSELTWQEAGLVWFLLLCDNTCLDQVNGYPTMSRLPLLILVS
jgi:hypothetical protein